MSLYSLVPDPQILLDMQPEEVGAVILQVIHEGARTNGTLLSQYKVNRQNFFGLEHMLQEYPRPRWEALLRVLMEGWMWLEHEGFLAPKPDEQTWFFLTRKGQRYPTVADLRSYREAARFPTTLLHPQVAERVWGDFIRGEYDTAVFKAFRDVEVAVRDTAYLPQETIGVPLMRKAFGPTGPLTDAQLTDGEADAMREFFSGAVGMFKNPHSHRNVALQNPDEAFEMLVIASHLMRIIDARLAN